MSKGKNPLSIFLNLEKHNQAKFHLCKQISDSVNVINDPSEILFSIKDLHATLCKCRSAKMSEDYLNTCIVSICQNLVKWREIIVKVSLQKGMLETLSAMKNGKSPGNDGRTEEFNMCFLMRFVILYLQH